MNSLEAELIQRQPYKKLNTKFFTGINKGDTIFDQEDNNGKAE